MARTAALPGFEGEVHQEKQLWYETRRWYLSEAPLPFVACADYYRQQVLPVLRAAVPLCVGQHGYYFLGAIVPQLPPRLPCGRCGLRSHRWGAEATRVNQPVVRAPPSRAGDHGFCSPDCEAAWTRNLTHQIMAQERERRSWQKARLKLKELRTYLRQNRT